MKRQGQRSKRSARRERVAASATPVAPARSRLRNLGWAGALAALLGLSGYAFCSKTPGQAPAAMAPKPEAAPAVLVPGQLMPHVHAQHPHDPMAFTQGLLWDRGRLFESTGLRGRSTLREVDLTTGNLVRLVEDEATLFGEGLALVDDRFIQLTWRDQRALVWTADTFSFEKEYSYRGEGWGLCYDGRELVMSDGTDTLTFRNKTTFAVERTVRVTREGQPQKMLNELECALGRIYANVWMTDDIVRIDPANGAIDAVIDASKLLPERGRADVLNGIAYVPETGRFLLTGKLWPVLFEVTFDAKHER